MTDLHRSTDQTTRAALLAHYNTYPDMQLGDLFKFLFQSAFGCEHLVSSREAAADYIAREYASRAHADEPICPLDGAYSRVPLCYMNHGLHAETLAGLLCASAKKEPDGMADLAHKLTVARELIRQGLLPFSPDTFDNAVKEWGALGFGPVHHSEAFRQTYAPAYRVISNDYVPFLPLLTRLDAMLAKGSVVLAIEGGSASGKTTLAHLMQELYCCTVFHMDDFFLRPEQRTAERYAEMGGNVDRERFSKQVLTPLCKGEPITYQKFDCATMTLSDRICVTPTRLTVIEGAYAMHPDLAAHYDLSVFLDVAPEVQRARIEQRNSPKMAQRFFDEWIPMERIYFEGMRVKERCDLSVEITK